MNEQGDYLEQLTKATTRHAAGRDCRAAIGKIIYGLLTTDEDRMRWVGQRVGTPRYKGWSLWYDQRVDEMRGKADALGWSCEDGDAGWVQFSRRGGQRSEGGSHKLYVTFDPGADLASGATRMPMLFDALGNVPTEGKLSFKIQRKFTGYLGHRDSLVVHFTDEDAVEAIQQAVASVGFNTLDRSTFHRVDVGRDGIGADGTKKSDTELVAEQVIRSIDAARDSIVRMPHDTLKEALSKLVAKVSMDASHRKGLSPHVDMRSEGAVSLAMR